MGAPVVDIEVLQGASFIIRLTIVNEATQTPIDITDYEFCGGIKQTQYDDRSYDYRFDKTDPTNGIVYAIIDPEVSAQIDFLQGVHDITYELINGTKIRVIQGTATIDLGGIGCA